MKGRTKNQQNKRYSRKSYSNSNKLTCFGSGKQGHLKKDCPKLVDKENIIEKKSYKTGKGRKECIAWEDNVPHPAALHRKRLKPIRA